MATDVNRTADPTVEATFSAYLAAFNRGDVDRLASLYAERTEFTNPFSTGPLTTRDEVRAFVEPMFRAYTGLHAEAEAPVCDGRRLATRLTITGTHSGELSGPRGMIAATGRQVTLRTAEFMEVDGRGLIVRHERVFDSAAVFDQLGFSA
jgi:steroid delta-isomerase-like uncharacterized protein